jgi:hypothetical protein
MKRLLIFLLFATSAVARPHDYTLHAPIVPPFVELEAIPPQVNTFCAANLNCTVTGTWSFSNLSSATFTGLVTTGTGTDTTSGDVPQNLNNVCGSVASPIIAIGLGISNTCTHSILYYGGAPIVPPNGFAGATHRSDLYVAAGHDVQSAVTEYIQANCNGLNSGGILNENTTNCLAVVGGTVNGAGATSSQVASDFVAKNFSTALGSRLVQASQLLSLTSRCAGWFGDTACDYSPMQTNVIFSGSNNITSYFGTASSATGKGALIGEFLSDVINTGHAILHGVQVARPDNGYWCGAAITSCEFIGAGEPYTVIGGLQPLYSDSPTYGVIHGEKAANSGQSNVAAFFSTNAGTSCTLLAAPNGASEVGNVSTYTCNAPISGNFAAGSIAHITGVGQSGYNIDCVIQSVTTPAFTCNNSNITTAVSNISGASEAAGTVTITTSATCPFTTGETVTIANVLNGSPLINNGYNGAFTVLTPGCSGGSTFTYTNPVTGLPTCASIGTCTGASGTAPQVIGNPLPASGAGTVVASARQAFTEYHDASSVLHWGYASPPAGNGADTMTLTNTGVLGLVSINASGNVFATSGVVSGAAYRTTAATPSAAGAFRLGTADTINWENNAASGNLALAHTALDQLQWPGSIVPAVAGTGDLGSTLLPYGNLWLGTAATNNFKFQPAATAAARVINLWDFGANGPSTQNYPGITILTSQYTNSTTGFTNVTGGNTLQFPVLANTTYTAECHLYYQSVALGGLNIEFTGPAAPTAVIYGLSEPTALGTTDNSVATAYSTSLGNVIVTAATNFDALVSFSLINGANAGTVNLLAKASTAVQLQIQAGSFCKVQ